MGRPLFVAGLLLALAAAPGALGGLLLSRPASDCLSRAVTTLNYNFWPKDYQLQSIADGASSSGFATTVNFAEDFSVSYRGTYKVVVNKRVNETYVLYQCGSPNPLDAADTEQELPAGTKVFEVPLVSVAVTDSNAAGFLAELGLVDRVALSSKYSYDSCLQAIYACGGESVSPSEPSDYDPSPANDAEYNQSLAQWRVLAADQDARVDAVLADAASQNPKSIAVTAYADPGVLNRAEWVKFVAVFFNKELEADALFSRVEAEYGRLNASARAAAAARAGGPAKAAWLSSQGGGRVGLNYAQYKRQYMTDAGADLLDTAAVAAAGGERVEGPSGALTYQFNTSIAGQRQALVELLKQVDVIFDDSYAANTSNLADLDAFVAAYGLSAADAAQVPAIAGGAVWTFNPRLGARQADGSVGSDWFEGAVARPDLVLRDFVKVLTPSALGDADSKPPVFLRQLSSSAPLLHSGPAGCASLNATNGAAGRCARAEPAPICPNAYRDCSTGELKAVADPDNRCRVQVACADAAAPNGSAANATAKNGAARPAAGAALRLLLAAAPLALLL